MQQKNERKERPGRGVQLDCEGSKSKRGVLLNSYVIVNLMQQACNWKEEKQEK
jgi:hypothetical protein